MKRILALLAASGLAATLAAPVANARPDDGGVTARERQALSIGAQTAAKSRSGKPKGANPYLALLRDPSKADYAGWRRYLQQQSQATAAVREQKYVGPRAERRILVQEQEPAGIRGGNDSVDSGQRIRSFGTGPDANHRARILGTLSPEVVFSEAVDPNTEDDGSIPLARDTGIPAEVDGIAASGEIGDGPHGSAGSGSGDFDVYEVTGVAGEAITANIDTPEGDLDSMLLVFDAAGGEVAFNDDEDGLDSLVSFVVPEDGSFFVMVSGFATFPEDPFDSGSGFGAESEGPYDLEITQGETDLDYYGVRLRKGDVLGASLGSGGTQVSLYEADAVNVHGSRQDATFIYPMDTPLPGGGNAVTEHVADRTGWHFVAVEAGSEEYDVTVETYRPGLEDQPPRQTIFLDFNGARVNTGIWGGPGVRRLSPLRAFLGRWDVDSDRYDALVNRIVDESTENLREDLRSSGLNDDFRLRIRNSRDHGDPWGEPNVSRVIVGGTIDQSGIPTIGIAQSIDPGNFESEESALVLLDILSDPAGEEGDPSLNTYLTPESRKVAFIGQAVGNIVSHEAGHFFGDWHVDQFNDSPNLMDQGGNFPVLYGVGPDGVGGTEDDDDVDFGEDVFNPNEGYFGVEDTLSRLAVVLTR